MLILPPEAKYCWS